MKFFSHLCALPKVGLNPLYKVGLTHPTRVKYNEMYIAIFEKDIYLVLPSFLVGQGFLLHWILAEVS